MIARLLLLLALMLGLALGAGPIPGGQHVVSACPCGPQPDATLCCSSDEGPVSEAPLVAPTTPSLKLAITPALVLLGTAPTVVAESPSTFPKVAVCHSAPARLALLCTRLI